MFLPVGNSLLGFGLNCRRFVCRFMPAHMHTHIIRIVAVILFGKDSLSASQSYIKMDPAPKRQKTDLSSNANAAASSASGPTTQQQHNGPKIVQTKNLTDLYRAHKLSNGSWYYSHTKTGKTQWKLPPEVRLDKHGEPMVEYRIFPLEEDETEIGRRIQKKYGEVLAREPQIDRQEGGKPGKKDAK